MICATPRDAYAAGEADGRADDAAPPGEHTAAQVAALAAPHIKAEREAS
jgi:hypothetical protein